MEIRNKEVKDALDELIVDESQSTDVNLLASLIKECIVPSKEGNIKYEPKFYKCSEWKRMMLYLLVRKAIVLKKLRDIKEKATYKEVADGAFIPATSVPRTHLQNLKGIVLKDKEGFFIPNYNLIKCKMKLEEQKIK